MVLKRYLRVTYKNLDKNYSFQFSHFLPYDEAFWILTNVFKLNTNHYFTVFCKKRIKM